MRSRLLPVVVVLAGCTITIPGSLPGAADATVGDGPVNPFGDLAPIGGQDTTGFAIASVTPAYGPVAGGTRVRLAGAGFVQGAVVVFGESVGSQPVVQNAGSIEVTTPPGPGGPATVTVRLPDGHSTRLAGGFYYETDLGLDGITPASGPAAGGIPVTVRGKGFVSDAVLVVGGREAVGTQILDDATLTAILPPGSPGPRDVVVAGALGTVVLKKAFQYFAAPAVTGCDPAVVATGGASTVTVLGSGLAGATAVLAGSGTATPTGAAADAALPIRLAGEAPGPVGITVVTPGGVATLPGCVQAATQADPATPTVLGVAPAWGGTDGGDEVRVAVAGLADVPVADVSVRFGDAAGVVLEVLAPSRALRVQTPAHAAGVVDVSATVAGASSTATGAFAFVDRVRIDAITPSSGPASGGTHVHLAGIGLERVREVRIGPLPAILAAGGSATGIDVVTEGGSPGLQDLSVATDRGETQTLHGVFTYKAAATLRAVSPARGAIAGGARVVVVGAGFVPGVTVSFGTRPATVLDASDPGRLLVLSPAGAAGPADVSVQWPGGALLTLAHAWTWFDPTGFFGGVWGDPVDGAVNVTVLDSYVNKPVSLAYVLLGTDPASPLHGLTDLKGQVTLSADDLFGPVEVTAGRSAYSNFTIAGTDAENITIFLDPIVPPSSGGGGTTGGNLPASNVVGTVQGADKHLLAPAGTCSGQPLVNGTLCSACVVDADCGAGSLCARPDGGGGHCAALCTVPRDCPDGYACFGLAGGTNACLPTAGRAEVRCGISDESLFSGSSDGGPGAIAAADGSFAVASRPGDVALYCVGGFVRSPSGVFQPTVLGLVRHVAVTAGQVTASDVPLTIPLDAELVVRLDNIPGGPGGPDVHTLSMGLDLGSDGVLSLWPDQQALDATHFVVTGLPESLDGLLDGARYDFESEADSQTTTNLPSSASMVQNWTPGSGNRVLSVGATAVVPLAPDVLPQMVGGCALPAGGGVVLGIGGRAWAVDPSGGVEDMPSLSTGTLRACAPLPGGGVLAVGDDGRVADWDGQLASAEATATAATLRAVSVGADGSAWAAGDGALARRTSAGAWTAVDPGTTATLSGIVASSDGTTAVAVGAGGLALLAGPSGALPLLPWPMDRDLLAAVPWGPGVLAVGARGAVVGIGFLGQVEPIPAPSTADLTSALALPDGSVLVGGTRGTVALWRGGAWTILPSADFPSEVGLLVPAAAPALAVAVGYDSVVVGPFLHLPAFSSPPQLTFWKDLTITWTRDGPPAPSMSYLMLAGASGGADWTLLAAGNLDQVVLPDLSQVTQVSPPPSGSVLVRDTEILIDGFSFDNFDDNSLSSDQWRSWDQVIFTTMR